MAVLAVIAIIIISTLTVLIVLKKKADRRRAKYTANRAKYIHSWGMKKHHFKLHLYTPTPYTGTKV